jgi:hypothetical protein
LGKTAARRRAEHRELGHQRIAQSGTFRRLWARSLTVIDSLSTTKGAGGRARPRVFGLVHDAKIVAVSLGTRPPRICRGVVLGVEAVEKRWRRDERFVFPTESLQGDPAPDEPGWRASERHGKEKRNSVIARVAKLGQP